MISLFIAFACLTPSWQEEADGAREEARKHYERAVEHFQDGIDEASVATAGVILKDARATKEGVFGCVRNFWGGLREKVRGDKWEGEARQWEAHEIPGDTEFTQQMLDNLWRD